MNKESRALGLIGITAKAGKIVCGTEAVEETIIKRKSRLVIVAQDASEKTKNNMKHKCAQYSIPIAEFSIIEKLSKAIGKQNKAVISIRDINLGEEIYKIICGGEAIG